MSRNRRNPHKNFMMFHAVLFIAVLFITALFLYLAYTFKRDADRKRTYEGKYHIELTADFVGESLSIYVNDSLLINRTMPDSIVTIDINRFAEEHILMLVNNQTDNTTPFNLSKEGSTVNIQKKEGEIIIEETPARF